MTDTLPEVEDVKRKLRANADALRAWAKSFDEHVRQSADPLFGSGYGIEQRVHDLGTVSARMMASLSACIDDCADGFEALLNPSNTGYE